MQNEEPPKGILLVDKPAGMTSHDVVAIARRRLKIRKIGHAGTLDPLATGLLILLVGKATKLFDTFMGQAKEYAVGMELGRTTTTGDRAGEVVRECPWEQVTEAAVRQVMVDMTGEIIQVPPMYSSLKHKGERLYKLARQGQEVEREPRPVMIYENRVDRIELPVVEYTVRCGKGTYVRKLSEDLGEALGTCAYTAWLRRTRIGEYDVSMAVKPEAININELKSVD